MSINTILREEELSKIIPANQLLSLRAKRFGGQKDVIHNWLCLSEVTMNYLQHVDFGEDSNQSSDSDDENEVMDSSFLDVYTNEFSNISQNYLRNVGAILPRNWNKLVDGKNCRRIINDHISNILRYCEPLTERDALKIENVATLQLLQRWKLYKYWVKCLHKENHENYLSLKQKLADVKLIYGNSWTKNAEEHNLEQNIHDIKNLMKFSYSFVFSESVMKDYIPYRQYTLLRKFNRINLERNQAIFNWLELNFENKNDIKERVKFIQYLEGVVDIVKKDESFIKGKTVQTLNTAELKDEGEDDIDHIEAERNFVSEEFADVSFSISSHMPNNNLHVSNDTEWQIQGGKKMFKRYIQKNLYNNETMSKSEADLIQDVWTLSVAKRWQLYKFWWYCYMEMQQAKTLDLQMKFRESYKELNELLSLEDVHVCREAQVVGMTTTGAAKYKHIVQQLNPVVVVVEEAAEILESHIVTSLASQTEHVILIGDHQQLRPSPTVHMLSVKYGLNISLFERMIKNGMDYQQLNIQHRMRPEIASLLVPHIYSALKNHDSVSSFENIRGVMKNVFFISHNSCELQESDTKSKVNQYEAKFLIRLCKYFILQNYDPSQITVLTTYSGQLFELKRLSKGILGGVKFTVVDNYQGEENDIVLISFVRSNEDGEIGFLKNSNRVCVALSRARKGLYGIGNFHLLAEKSPLWRQIISVMQRSDSIGSHLQLVCQNHPTRNITVADEKDFDSVLDGGCTLKCEYRLTCGHTCPKFCHPYDVEHNDIQCLKPCTKSCSEGHVCEKKCFEVCGSCYEPIVIKIDSCGHEMTAPCYLKNTEIKCTEPSKKTLSCGHEMVVECYIKEREVKCTELSKKILSCGHEMIAECYLKEREVKCTELSKKTLSCGHEMIAECYLKEREVKCTFPCQKFLDCDHKCHNLCGEECETKCEVESKITSKFCGHEINDKCFRSHDAEYLNSKCNAPCNHNLLCSHICRGTCSECHQGRLHVACFEKCRKKLVCGHDCQSSCSKSCPPCRRPCDNWCNHNKCLNKCSDVCKKCPKSCEWICPHKACTRLCSEQCDRTPCDEPCIKLLDCQHPCIGFCGEPCPELCRICNTQEVSEMLLSSINQNDARFVLLEDCNHIFEVGFITHWICNENSVSTGISRKTCPKCETVIRKNLRFGNIIKATNEDIEHIKLYVKVLYSKINNLLPLFRDSVRNIGEHVFTPLQNVIMSKTCRTIQELMIIYNFLTFSQIYIDAKASTHGYLDLDEDLIKYIASTLSWITPIFQNDYLTASDAQLFDLGWELHRLKLANVILHQSKIKKDFSVIKYLSKCILNHKPFRNAELQRFILKFKIYPISKSLSFNGTDLIKQPALSTVNLSENHWYKCKKGNIHRHTKLGDEMERSVYNKCEETI